MLSNSGVPLAQFGLYVNCPIWSINNILSCHVGLTSSQIDQWPFDLNDRAVIYCAFWRGLKVENRVETGDVVFSFVLFSGLSVYPNLKFLVHSISSTFSGIFQFNKQSYQVVPLSQSLSLSSYCLPSISYSKSH
jgi:hypothetical protein